MPTHPITLALAAAMVLLAGILRGFTGFGFSLAAVPLLSLIMPPAQAVPIVFILQLLVSVAGLREALRLCDWRSVRMLGLGAALATPVGVWGLAHLSAAPVRLVIAAIVAVGAAILARGARMRTAPKGLGILPFGLAAGLFGGLSGIPGPPVIAFYLASPIPSGVARASMIVVFLLTSFVGLAPLLWFGLLGSDSLLAAAASLPAVLLGSWLGAAAYARSKEGRYRTVALTLLLLTAALAAWRAAMDYA